MPELRGRGIACDHIPPASTKIKSRNAFSIYIDIIQFVITRIINSLMAEQQILVVAGDPVNRMLLIPERTDGQGVGTRDEQFIMFGITGDRRISIDRKGADEIPFLIFGF